MRQRPLLKLLVNITAEIPALFPALQQGQEYMSNRIRLPHRHLAVTLNFEVDSQRYVATAGFFPEGNLAEIFINSSGKLGLPYRLPCNMAARPKCLERA
jgi:hypothetical protein